MAEKGVEWFRRNTISEGGASFGYLEGARF